MSLLLGAIADDFTGATDLANTLVSQGMRVVQQIGVPTHPPDLSETDAIVIALKSRTAETPDAVAESVRALHWLQQQNCAQFFFKYCSTFDSTSEGNIGPVADALMQHLDCEMAIICPAFPTNQRSIREGNLYVGDLLLAESPMKDHPLTPMRDSNLIRLMGAQSDHTVGLVPLDIVRAGSQAIVNAIEALKLQDHRYAVIDATSDEDLATIGIAAAGHKLVTGGSGIAIGLPHNFGISPRSSHQTSPLPEVKGRELVLAGSCSQMTRAQITQVSGEWPSRKIKVSEIIESDDLATEITGWALSQTETLPVLIYASAEPAEVEQVQQQYGVEAAGVQIEKVMGELAEQLVQAGFTRLIVAGGETSGAVVSALDIKALRIGLQIDPGIPWTETTSGAPLALALKSGNFGSLDFFAKAFRMLA